MTALTLTFMLIAIMVIELRVFKKKKKKKKMVSYFARNTCVCQAFFGPDFLYTVYF